METKELNKPKIFLNSPFRIHTNSQMYTTSQVFEEKYSMCRKVLLEVQCNDQYLFRDPKLQN